MMTTKPSSFLAGHTLRTDEGLKPLDDMLLNFPNDTRNTLLDSITATYSMNTGTYPLISAKWWPISIISADVMHEMKRETF
jgi:hypothetical protein